MQPESTSSQGSELPVDSNRIDLTDDEKLAAFASALADGIEQALPRWVESRVERVLVLSTGVADEDVMAEARAAALVAQVEVSPEVRALLARDIDDQPTNPLAIVRMAVRFPTEVLRAAGVPTLARDVFVERQFPDDVYNLAPASFADIDPSLRDIGLAWGAAKAHVHLRRRAAEAKR